MLKEIARAVEALKEVDAKYHDLVLAEAAGKKKTWGKAKGGKVKPGPKPGSKFTKSGQPRKKPGPAPGFKKKKAKAVEGENLPVKVDPKKLQEKRDKAAKLKAAAGKE